MSKKIPEAERSQWTPAANKREGRQAEKRVDYSLLNGTFLVSKQHTHVYEIIKINMNGT
jgi:hypothetical protein